MMRGFFCSVMIVRMELGRRIRRLWILGLRRSGLGGRVLRLGRWFLGEDSWGEELGVF